MVRSNQPDPVIDVEEICESYNISEKMRIYRAIFPINKETGDFSSVITKAIEGSDLPSEFASDIDHFARSYLVKRLGMTLPANASDGIDGVHSGAGSIVLEKMAAVLGEETASFIINMIRQQVEEVFQEEIAKTNHSLAR